MIIYHAIVLDTDSVKRILRGEQTAIGQATQRRRHSAGKVGDILWVKERWRYAGSAEGLEVQILNQNDVYYFADDAFTPDIPWRNAVTMPFNVSRLHLRIEAIKSCTYAELTEAELQRLGRNPFTRKLRVVYTEFSIHHILNDSYRHSKYSTV